MDRVCKKLSKDGPILNNCYQLYISQFQLKLSACEMLANGRGVGKCPAPAQCKIFKCPTPGTDKAGKCPTVAGGGGGAGRRWN